jgi:hypothetical protein
LSTLLTLPLTAACADNEIRHNSPSKLLESKFVNVTLCILPILFSVLCLPINNKQSRLAHSSLTISIDVLYFDIAANAANVIGSVNGYICGGRIYRDLYSHLTAPEAFKLQR